MCVDVDEARHGGSLAAVACCGGGGFFWDPPASVHPNGQTILLTNDRRKTSTMPADLGLTIWNWVSPLTDDALPDVLRRIKDIENDRARRVGVARLRTVAGAPRDRGVRLPAQHLRLADQSACHDSRLC